MSGVRGMHYMSFPYQVTAIHRTPTTTFYKAFTVGTCIVVDVCVNDTFDRQLKVHVYNLRTGGVMTVKMSTWLKVRRNFSFRLVKMDMNKLYDKVVNNLVTSPKCMLEDEDDLKHVTNPETVKEDQDETFEESTERFIGDDLWLPKE